MLVEEKILCDKKSSLKENICFGYIPNEALKELSYSQAIVYVIIQHLSFFNRKITANIVAELANSTASTIENSISSMKKKGIVRKVGAAYEFKNYKTSIPNTFVKSKDVSKIHKGYLFPFTIISDKNISYGERLTFGVLCSMMNFGKNYTITVPFIANVFGKSHDSLSPILQKLDKHLYIERTKKNTIGTHSYSIGTLGTQKLMRSNCG